MTRRILAALVVLAALVAGLWREDAGVMLVGWICFLQRNLPQVAVSTMGVATGVAAVALSLALTHCLGRSWFRAASEAPDAAGRRWRFRWSLSLLVALAVMFAAGFSAVGLARHLGWMLSSPSPIYEEHVFYHQEHRGG